MFNKFAHLTSAFTDQRKDSQVRGCASCHYADKRALTHARPAEDPHALAFAHRKQAIDSADARDQLLVDVFALEWTRRNAEKHKLGCYFYGSKGTFHMGWRDGWTFYPANAREKVAHEAAQLQEPDGHNIKLLWADFLKAIENGTSPVADIERAHRATTAVLLAMLSMKIGRSVAWDGQKEQIPGDAEANALLSRPYRGPWTYPQITQ